MPVAGGAAPAKPLVSIADLPPAATAPGAAENPLPFEQLDRYRLESFLGAGAMGQVYRATHTVTKRVCALKVLPDGLARQPDFVKRFLSEAEILARLNHPQIVQIYSGGEASGKLFLEMEFMAGGDLQRYLDRHAAALPANAPHRGLPEKDAHRFLDAMLAALDYAHRAGVVHRDLKPANLLLHADGTAKVSDFGLAAAAGVDFQRSTIGNLSLTKISSMETVVEAPSGSSSSFAGTILYMSPEALRGQAPDPRDDLFSVGVIAYTLLTGRTPAVNYKPISRVRPDAAKEWDAFIARCLEEERAARFQSSAEARAALPAPPKAKAKSSPVALIVALGVAGLALVGCGFAGWVLLKKFIASRQPASATVAPAPASPTAHPSAETPSTPHETEGVSGTSSAAPAAGASSSANQAPATPTAAAAPSTSSSAPSSSSAAFDFRPATETRPAPTANVEPAPVRPAPLQPQVIAFAPIGPRTLQDGAVTLAASTTSGLPVEFELVSGPATLRGDTLTPTDAGMIAVRALQRGDARHAPAESIVQMFRVDRSVAVTPAVTPPAAPSTSSAAYDPPRGATTPTETATEEPPATDTAATPDDSAGDAAAVGPSAYTAQGKAAFGPSAGTVRVPANLTAAAVRHAIQFTLEAKGWSLTDRQPGRTVGYLRQRGSEATVTFLYDRTVVELYCLGYELDRNGAPLKPQQPTAALTALRQELTKQLNQAARLRNR